MFKKFTPKEDIASATAMKSSIQRQHRAKLLEQIPFLSLPAMQPLASTSSTMTSHVDNNNDSEDDSDDDNLNKRKKGAGKDKKDKRAKDKASKRSGGNKRQQAVQDSQQTQPTDEEQQTTEPNDQTDEDTLTVMDVLWPKKESLTLIKFSREHISILALHGEPLFFQHFDGPYFPTLRVLHKYPGMLPKVGVDRGAIKFVLSGANIMCPGLTSPTAYLPPTEQNIPSGQPVAVFAYGKEEPLAIGITKMSTDDIRAKNKDIGVDNVTFLGDDLWKVDKLT
ncbi:translation machinery-associated protein 20 [Microbotryomycetes sp. JL221]|nr:translation machinery-associated protein 20 [Microbotryomycetes sp. JL221]